MSITGNGALSLRKKDVKEQKSIAVGFKKLVFAHKAALGETGITLSSLTTPTEMSSVGFTNPTSQELLSAQLKFFRNNLKLISSLKGLLQDYLSYTISDSGHIVFNGFTSEDGEIFTGIIDHNARTGVQMVDASAIVSTGTLAIGATDYNVGTPFEINKYPLTQAGAVLVYRNGSIQFRNPSNGTSGGNYQEVQAGGGLGVVIRFNTAPVGSEDNILVVSNGLIASRPDGSMLAEIENLAGQMDKVVEVLSDVSGEDESFFQAAPNNTDLKAFGDLVYSLKQRLDNVVYDQFDYIEYSGALKTGDRILPQVLRTNLGMGALNVTNLVSAGTIVTLKNGWYSFNAKIQLTSAGTGSITRNNSTVAGGNNSDVLCSVVPVTNQEFVLHWEGYLPASSIISFNTTGTIANNASIMFYANFFGSKAPTTI